VSTTIFIPMPEWQALLFLRDREKAFGRLLSPDRKLLNAEEVVPTEDGLYGFRVRSDAVEHGYREYPNGFAMMRIVIPKFLYGNLTVRRNLLSATVPDTGVALWRIATPGLRDLRQNVLEEKADLMVDEIFGGQIHKPLMARPCADGSSCDHDDGHDKGIILDSECSTCKRG
jgi:hypothetical protein